MTVQDWLGKDNQLGIDIWEKKYRNGEETFEQWLDRVSNGNKPLRQLIMDKKFLFGGRTLSNRGIAKSGTYFNCYSLGYIEDDYKQILQAAMDMGLTYKAQGGQGVSLTKIRPLGTPIGTRYKSDGIVPFMRLYNSVTTETSQGGARKGALMISLDIRHKEAETFITLKNQGGVVEKANLSLEIDDDFMRAVKAYYDTGQEIVLHEIRDYGVHHIEYDIIPIKLYKLLVQNCYDWGDPACLFTNRFRNYNLMELDENYQIETSNPSLRKGTPVLTENGIFPIESLEGIDFHVYNLHNEKSSASCFLSGKNKQLYEITLDNHKKYYCTKEHKWAIKEKNGYVKTTTEHLKSGDFLPITRSDKLSNGTLGGYSDGFLCGFWYGDGSFTKRSDDGRNQYGFTFGKKDKDNGILNIIIDKLSEITGKEVNYCTRNRGKQDWYETSSSDKKLDDYFKAFHIYSKKDLTDIIYTDLSEDFRRGLIDGLFSADGHVSNLNKKTFRVSLASSNLDFLNKISDLMWWYGIRNNISSRTAVCNLNGKTYTAYNLSIGKLASKRFSEIFKLTHADKQRVLESISEITKDNLLNYHVKVISVKPTDIFEDVWDIRVNDFTHTFRLNYSITGNCGEQPLPKNFCCNLGSLNLSAFVKNQFTDDAYFDYEDFFKSIEIAVEALDELIDENAENHPLESQKINSLNYRNIGLGITGYGTALMMLQTKYGSDEAKEFTDDFMSSMFEKAFSTSSYLAERKGSFPLYKDVIFDSEIVRNHSNSLINMFKPMGLRNCSLLSFAPAGTLSLLFGVTSGIEPEFSISYKRKTESLINNEPSYYDVYCNAYLEYKNITGKTDMPDYFVTAKDISWKDRIDTQSIMQYHLDTAISSTINLSQDTSIKDVEELYLYAWEKGLKGITIFRDGCKRLGILTTDNKTEKPKEPQKEELGRGFILDISNDVVGKKRKLMTGCGSLHCVAFFDPQTGNLLETYLSKGSTGGCQNFMVGLSRMISLSARAGCDINSIVNQLDSCGVCPSYSVRSATKHDTSKGSCCPMAIGNALIEMHNEMLDEIGVVEREDDYNLYDSLMTGLNEAIEIETISKDVCPDCGEPLIFEGGCNTCKNCGWSKCT